MGTILGIINNLIFGGPVDPGSLNDNYPTLIYYICPMLPFVAISAVAYYRHRGTVH